MNQTLTSDLTTYVLPWYGPLWLIGSSISSNISQYVCSTVNRQCSMFVQLWFDSKTCRDLSSIPLLLPTVRMSCTIPQQSAQQQTTSSCVLHGISNKPCKHVLWCCSHVDDMDLSQVLSWYYHLQEDRCTEVVAWQWDMHILKFVSLFCWFIKLFHNFSSHSCTFSATVSMFTLL